MPGTFHSFFRHDCFANEPIGGVFIRAGWVRAFEAPLQDEVTRLASWFDAHGARLILYARQWLDLTSAEDAVQEVFLKLLTQASPPQNLAAWLFTAVRNQALSQHRQRSRSDRREREVGRDRQGWFERHPSDLVDAAAAEAALADLPPEQREVIVLRLWGGLTLAEVSQVLGGEATSTLFSRYQAGLKAIRQKMETSCATKK